MRKERSLLRSVGLSTGVIALAVAGVLVPAGPASARAKDCTIEAALYHVNDNLIGRAIVKCPRVEKFRVGIYVFRGSTQVASYSKSSETTYEAIIAREPCSDVQTNKKYSAVAELYDTQLIYPIKVKDARTGEITGPC